MFPKEKRGGFRPLWLPVLAGLIAGVLVLVGCGSSSSSSSSSGGEPAGSEAGTTTTASSSPTGADPSKVYAPGVPTLNELYEGSEGTPPKSGPPAKKGVEVIWVSCGQEASGCSEPAAAFGEAAKALGWKYKVIDGKLNVDDGWANGIRTAIAAHPDAIITEGMDCQYIKQPLEEAKAAGIALVEFEEVDCNDPRVGGPKMYNVPTVYSEDAKNTVEWFERYGENQANYIIDATEGKAKVMLVPYAGLFGENQQEAWERQLAKCKECEILETLPFEVSEQVPNGPLFERFSTALVKYPDANSAIFAFDSEVIPAGLSKAIVDAGRAGDMIVSGGESHTEVLQLLEEEKGVNGEPGTHSTSWSTWAIADEINRVLSDQPPVPQGVGFKLVDKEHNLPPKGQTYETEIDFKKAYEEVWNGKK